MSAAPRTHAPSSPKPQRRRDAAAIVAQLDAMFGAQEGWIEAWHGQPRPSDPGKIELDLDHAHRWHWYTRARQPDLVSLLLSWAARYGNVYISTTLYDRPARPKHGSVPLPSRVIFVDDAPERAPLCYSMAIETSAGNRQGYYLLSEAVDAATREDLQRRIAYALGADRSGADVEQLGRVPGSWNTKRGGRYPVTLSPADGPRYSVDELAAHFPPVAAVQAAGALAIDDQELAHWLGNVDAIMRRIRPGTPTYQTLQSDGGRDRSVARWATACNLRKLYGLPSVEIAAILLTCCDWGHSTEKGSRWLYDDVRRCIADAEREYPHATISATRGAQARPAVTLPEVTRQPRGRRRTHDADDYYAWLCERADCGHVMLTQRQIAAAYDASIPTIRRLERTLRKQGDLRRMKTANKQGSWLELLRAIINTPAADCAAAAENMPETAPDVRSQTPGIKDAPTRKEEHTAPSVPPDVQPRPAAYPAAAAAIREAFDAYSGARITRQRIAGYLEANYPGAPWDGELLRRCYGLELARRQRERQRERQLAALPSMPHAKLRRLDRWCERLLEEGPDGPGGGKYYMARWLAPHVAQELASERRRAALERVTIRPRQRPAPVQTLTEWDATPPLLALVGDPEQVTKSDTAPAAYVPGEVWRALWHGPDSDEPITVIGLWDASVSPDGRVYYQVRESATGMPADDVELVDLVSIEPAQDGAPLGAVCSSPLPAGPLARTQTPPARIRPYVPDGGWTAAAIAALPGVACGSTAPDDPWIVLQRELATKAAQAVYA